jgi:hypothetical protein
VDAHLKKAFKRAEKEDLKGSSKRQKSEQSEKKSQSSDRSFHRERAFSADQRKRKKPNFKRKILSLISTKRSEPF